jgi:hypothetical protein
MFVLRKLMITVLIVSAAIAVPSAALASTTQHAAAAIAAFSGSASALQHAAPRPPAATTAVPPSADAVPAKVGKVPCRSWTFNVSYGTRGETCYEGAGTIRPDIKNVRRITTRENTGLFFVQAEAARELSRSTRTRSLSPAIRACRTTHPQITGT